MSLRAEKGYNKDTLNVQHTGKVMVYQWRDEEEEEEEQRQRRRRRRR